MQIKEILSNEDFDKYAVAKYKEHCEQEKRVVSMYELKLWVKAFRKGAVAGIETLANELEKEDA